MATDFVIVANPVSGSHAAPELATRAQELLQRAGKTVRLRVTQARGHAGELAAQAAAEDAGAVVGCGGDGTLQEIAGALDGSQTALGILPRGRCNDFAFAVGLGKQDAPEKLVQALLNGRRQATDLGAMGPKRFLTVATLGFDSEVSRFVETRKLWLKGTPAYVYGIARTLISFRSPLVRLKWDDGELEARLLLAATGNAPCYGGAMRIAPGAQMHDGKFQLCVVRAVSRLTVLRIFPRVMKGTHVSHPAVSLVDARSVEISTPERPVWICADGESLGQTPCKLEVRPGALQVLVPEKIA